MVMAGIAVANCCGDASLFSALPAMGGRAWSRLVFAEYGLYLVVRQGENTLPVSFTGG